MNLLAAGVLFLAAIKERKSSQAVHRVFILFGTGYLCTFLGDVIMGLVQHGPILSSKVDLYHIFFFLYYPLILIGILQLPVVRLRRMERIRRTIEVIAILLALVLIYWNFLFAPVFNHLDGRLSLPDVIQYFFPFTGLLLLFGVMILTERLTNRISSLFALFFALSLITMILFDGIFSWHVLNETYQPGGFVQIGWLISAFLALCAGYSELHRDDEGTFFGINQRKLDLLVRRYQGKLVYIQYLYLIGIFIFLIQSHFLPMAVGFTPFAIVLGIILILVILQQILAMRENQNLNEELMIALRTIQVRQDELLQLNQSLQVEIAERKSLEKRLQHDVLHDPLTGLPNRVLFLDRLGQAIELGIRHPRTNYAVLFLDLDQFKSANDEFGHFCGDRLLVEVSRRLHSSLRATDTVARLGGDEFVFLLEDVTVDGIHEVIERIKDQLNPPIWMMGKSFQITASIGVVHSLHEYNNPEQVLEDADRAMYQAKSQGKDGYAIHSRN